MSWLLALSFSQIQILAVVTAGVMEWHRAVHFSMHELMHKIPVRCPNLIGCSFRHDHPVRHEVDIVHDLQGLLHIMGDHYRGRTQRVIQAPDCLLYTSP